MLLICWWLHTVQTHTDSITLQNDLIINPWRVGEEMEDETEYWQMHMVLTVTLKNTLHNHASVTSAKYLGVIATIDSKLSFNEHVVITCKKANSVLAFLCRNFRSSQRKIKTDLHLTYVKPILDYSVSVWAPHANRAINQLDSIQWCGAHFVMSDYCCTSSVSSMLSSLHWYNTKTQHKKLVW